MRTPTNRPSHFPSPPQCTRFEDAFKFLRGLPPDQHCWCGHREIALPLLEPFYHYDTMLAEAEEEGESTLSGLWKHMKRDMASCINCVCAHHEAKKYYEREYEEEVVQPMLGILKRLDEERVEGQLRRLRGGLGAGEEGDAAQLVCVIFEVMYRFHSESFYPCQSVGHPVC